jgi:23S rRNA (guanine2445-N2)-methyltransferase / 23S rRNA (guanine2069-N7)-methyltransferase
VTVSLDLSGDSLHRRGYRADEARVAAPLKEHLAAAVLRFAAWHREAAAGGSLLDPLCGSGTLPIEAAWMAGDVAPGLLRVEAADASPAEDGRAPRGGSPAAGDATTRSFGFTRWRGHDASAWAVLVAEAQERRHSGLSALQAAAPDLVIRGGDRDGRAIDVARACAERAGLSGIIAIERADLADALPPAARGLVAANTPYGERLGDRAGAEAVCRLLGERLRAAFDGWRAVVLAGDPGLAATVGLPAARDTALRNGALECTLSYHEVGAPGSTAPRSARAAARSSAGKPRRGATAAGATASAEGATAPTEVAPDASTHPAPGSARRASGSAHPASGSGAEQLANRLRRNLRHIGRTMRRQGVTCYRLYDADLPQYSLAVDVYEHRLHVQEYAPPAEIDPARAATNLSEAIEVIVEVLEVERRDIVVKQRRRQRGADQYERFPTGGALQRVSEDGLAYLVDLERYLDTGLFLDQRETRRLIRRLAGGRRFLNLFAYTSTATVCAIAGGASATTSVDLSATYLEWSRRNLSENGVDDVILEAATRGREAERRGTAGRGAATRPAAHRLVQADCLAWLAEADGQYDLILLDPPTFSNSKRMGHATFDVQRDHPDLIRMTARRLLAPGGILLFACNKRAFKLDPDALPGLNVRGLSRATLARDFARRANAHHVWRLEPR